MSTPEIILPAGYVRCSWCGRDFLMSFMGDTEENLRKQFWHTRTILDGKAVECRANTFEIRRRPGQEILWSENDSERVARQEFQKRCDRITEMMKRKEELQARLAHERAARIMSGCVSELKMLELLGVECAVTVSWRKHNKSKHYRCPRRAGTVFDVTPWTVTIAYRDGSMQAIHYEGIQVLSEKERREAIKRAEVEIRETVT